MVSLPWILDICLDYFSTLNPFLPELELNVKKDCEKFTKKENDELTSEKIIQIILNSFTFMKFRNIEYDKKYATNNLNYKINTKLLNTSNKYEENEIFSQFDSESGGYLIFSLFFMYNNYSIISDFSFLRILILHLYY